MDTSSPRIRGRKGMERRARILARDPLCVICKARGIYRPADQVDHVVPLHRGGPDTDDNLQGLCLECHEAKTVAEGGVQVSNHPEWLSRSLIPITLVCGPPCAGKSTHVRMSAGAQDLIVELDDILLSLDPAYRPWSGDRQHLDDAIRIRNRMLGSLGHGDPPHPRAWLTLSAPTNAERQWWLGKLGGELLLLDPGAQECKRRARARGTPGAVPAVDDWHRRALAPWTPRRLKVPLGSDGWPQA